jgi:HEPN domain-containing protein
MCKAVRKTGPIEEENNLEGAYGTSTYPDQDAEGLPIPLPTLTPDVPELIKAAINVVEAVERALDYLEDLNR